MSDRPMHTQPGAMARLQQLYAEAEAAIEAGALQDAVAKLTEGLAIDDHFRQRYVTQYAQRAFAYQRMGQLEPAIADYDRAIEMEPEINQAQYLFHRGMCFAGLGQFERAVADYGASIALHQGHPGPFHLRAKLLVNELHAYADALPDLDTLLSMQELPEGLQLRGCARVNLGLHAEAIPDLTRAQQLEPDSYNDYLLAACFAATGDEPRLQHHMQAALAGWSGYLPAFAEHADEFAPYRARPWFKQLTDGQGVG